MAPSTRSAQHEIRRFRPPHPTDVVATLAGMWRGRHDHTMVVVRRPHPVVWRATRTPDGPAVQAVRNLGADVEMQAWGPGAHWLAERAPTLVGGLDDTSAFRPDHALVADLVRRFEAVRIPCTQAVFEILVPVVLEQKVTGLEARRSFGRLQRGLAEPASAHIALPTGVPAMVLPLDPVVVAGTPSHVFHAAGVERKRSDTIRRAADVAPRLEEAAGMPLPAAHERLHALPGLGAWSVAEIALMALGDADAVSVGDFHLKHWVAWNLAAEARGTDEQMLELLEPFRPHRGRVLRLLQMGGSAPPRFGPRLTIQERW
jgi:3-methyladenine DNA glycosylase/8-oxoguanine DNA glycosylase